MKKIIPIFFVISSLASASENICLEEKSKGEGSWPIAELSFTKEAAKKSVEKLKKFISSGTDGMDSEGISNELLMVRGYLLKSRVGTGMLGEKEEFCNFIKNEAYVQH